MILENNWKNYYLPPDIIKGAALISGIYQPEIVLNLSVNKEIKLSKKEAIKNTPKSPKEKIPIILTCVGDQEPEGWIEQTKLYSKNAINMSNQLDFSILNDKTNSKLDNELLSDWPDLIMIDGAVHHGKIIKKNGNELSFKDNIRIICLSVYCNITRCCC